MHKLIELNNEKFRCQMRVLQIDAEIAEIKKLQGVHAISVALRDGAWAQAIYLHSMYQLDMGADTFTALAYAGYDVAKAWRLYEGFRILHGWRHDTQSVNDWLGRTYAAPELYGYTITAIQQGKDEILFTRTDGKVVRMGWHGIATAHVELHSIDGDITQLIGKPLEATFHTFEDTEDESKIWTIYKLSNEDCTVMITWYDLYWGAQEYSSVMTIIKD